MPRKQKVEKHKGVYEKYPGSGIWWIRYTNAQGKRVTESIGRHSDAVTIYQQRVTEKRSGILIPIGKSARGVKFASLVEDALKFSEGNHRDQRNFKQRIEVVKEHFGLRGADSITPKEIGEWLSQMAEEHEWTSATYNRYKAAISLTYKKGMQNSRVSTNPARFVPQRKESGGRIRFLTEEEETRLRAAIMNCRPHCSYQLDVALHTGMRKGEQFSVTWNQVDLKGGNIHLDKTKNGSDRYVQLNETALAALTLLKEDHKARKLEFDTLFYDRRDQPIRDPREWFAAACEEAKIKGVTWHTLRHTFASRLVMAGVDLKTVQELMGHKTIAMTARYAHLAPEHLKGAVNKLVKATGA
jgi:integrase